MGTSLGWERHGKPRVRDGGVVGRARANILRPMYIWRFWGATAPSYLSDPIAPNCVQLQYNDQLLNTRFFAQGAFADLCCYATRSVYIQSWSAASKRVAAALCVPLLMLGGCFSLSHGWTSPCSFRGLTGQFCESRKFLNMGINQARCCQKELSSCVFRCIGIPHFDFQVTPSVEPMTRR